MALPPDPIEDVFAEVDIACVARVVDVDARSCRAQIELEETLLGNAPKQCTVVMIRDPDYVLRVDQVGLFLLKQTKEGLRIVGRYGPESYSREDVLEAIAKRSN
jgi:hypothetical protein